MKVQIPEHLADQSPVVPLCVFWDHFVRLLLFHFRGSLRHICWKSRRKSHLSMNLVRKHRINTAKVKTSLLKYCYPLQSIWLINATYHAEQVNKQQQTNHFTGKDGKYLHCSFSNCFEPPRLNHPQSLLAVLEALLDLVATLPTLLLLPFFSWTRNLF